MGEENYTRVGTMSEALAQRAKRHVGSIYLGSPEGEPWEGRRVVHAVFGPGTIGEADPTGTSHRVDFDGMPTPRYLSDGFLARLIEEQEAGLSAVAVEAQDVQVETAAALPVEAGTEADAPNGEEER